MNESKRILNTGLMELLKEGWIERHPTIEGKFALTPKGSILLILFEESRQGLVKRDSD